MPQVLHAEAGDVLFVYGAVHRVSAMGERAALNRGQALETGDLVVTGSNGRVQIRMADGGLLALRPQSEFLIVDFHYPQLSAGGEDATSGQARSFFSLVKGGFRAITGAIAKDAPERYEVGTPVATIGIRGTDYTALYCEMACGAASLDPGLYLGVNEGRIQVRNDAGALTLGAGQFGYVMNAETAPRRTPSAASVLATHLTVPPELTPGSGEENGPEWAGSPVAAAQEPSGGEEAEPELNPASGPLPPPDATVPTLAEDLDGQKIDLTAGSPPPQPGPPDADGDDGTPPAPPPGDGGGGGDGTPVPDVSGAVAFALAHTADSDAFAGGSAAGAGQLERDPSGALIAFYGPPPDDDDGGHYALAGGEILNFGRDSQREGATELAWGRWSSGTLQSEGHDDETQLLGGLHWITGPDDNPRPLLPSSGTAQFALVGNTDPTDSAGRVGTLGSASLSANFDAQTVDAALSLSFAETGRVWDAWASELDISTEHATFDGGFDTVTISSPAGTRSGSGWLSGFFSGDAAGALTGAGLGYVLADEDDLSVSGTAAFERIAPSDP